MSEIMTIEEQVRIRNRLRQEVLDWMAEEGRSGRLRNNGQAPAWADYERAEHALSERLLEVGT